MIGGQDQVHVHDIARGTFTRLTLDGSNKYPAWSPDSEQVYFSSVVFETGGGWRPEGRRIPTRGRCCTARSISDPEGREVIDGLHASKFRRDADAAFVTRPGGAQTANSGYAGWGPQQLEGEINEGSWIGRPGQRVAGPGRPLTEDGAAWRR